MAFAGYPLLLENRLVGVMAMFARRRLTETALQAMESIANQIALGIERKRSDEALRRSGEQLHELTAAHSPGTVGHRRQRVENSLRQQGLRGNVGAFVRKPNR